MKWKSRDGLARCNLAANTSLSFYITFDATAPEEIRKIAASDAIGKFIDKAQVALDDLKACAKAHGAT